MWVESLHLFLSRSAVPLALRRRVYAYHITEEDARLDELWASRVTAKALFERTKVINFDLVNIMTSKLSPSPQILNAS